MPATLPLRYKYQSHPRLTPNPKRQKNNKIAKIKQTKKKASFNPKPWLTAGDGDLAGEMNIPAKLSSLSMSNARLSYHRRHVFHENLELQKFFTSTRVV